MTEFILFAKTKNTDFSYSVSVDEAVQGLVRVVVKRSKDNENDEGIYQGIDLTSEECEALGKHLLSVSERLNNY